MKNLYIPEGKQNFVDSLNSKIGEVFYENNKPYRMISGRKISEIDVRTDEDRKTNDAINLVRASGLSPMDFLNLIYG